MGRLISSSLTILYKFVFVAMGIGFFSMLTILLFAQGEHWWRRFGAWVFITLWNVIVLPLCLPLKRVVIEGNQLIVSSFVKSVRIDLSNVADVTEKTWVNVHPVLIHFRESTAFGRKIMFMPTVCLSAMGNSHPIVSELKRLAGLTESRVGENHAEMHSPEPDKPLELER